MYWVLNPRLGYYAYHSLVEECDERLVHLPAPENAAPGMKHLDRCK